MKRFFPIIISVILLCSIMFTGCNSSKETVLSTKDAFNINHSLLVDTFAEKTDKITFEDVTAVITQWADENNIDVASVNDKYLILSKDSSGELKNVESFTFHTCVELDSETSVNNSFSNAASVMTALSNAQNHGDLIGIFTIVEDGQPTGAAALDSEYLKSDNFIDVTYQGKNTSLYNTFAASSDMSAVKKLDITSPTYSKAYKIEFKGKDNQSAYRNRGTYPNPVKAIGDLLASSQTSTILFELASFNGGEYSDQIPSEVSATIVLHENDVESFNKKFENSYKKISDSYEDIDDEEITFEYTLTPVDLPDQVISKEDTENIVSLMYTMINGTYLRNDNDEVEAYSNIGKISTEDGKFKLDINAKALNDELMTELESVVETICGLSDINYKKQNSSKVWTNDSDLVVTLSDELSAECSSMLEMKHVAEFTDTDEDINLVCWATNADDADNDLEKIFEYMAIAGIEL